MGVNERVYMKMKRLFLLLILILIFCLTSGENIFAQGAERIEVDGSVLAAGQPFQFTVTVDSDENLSFADARSRLTAVMCPVDAGSEAGSDTQSDGCQILSLSLDGEDDFTMRVIFTAEALPKAGDYTLDVSFTDENGTFASQTAAYLIRGVREEGEGSTPTPTPGAELLIGGPTQTPTPTPGAELLIGGSTAVPVETETAESLTATAASTETIQPDLTETVLPEQTETVLPDLMETVLPEQTETVLPEPTATEIPLPTMASPGYDPEQPTVTLGVILSPSMQDESGNALIYGSTLYVGETYLLQVQSDRAMNDSVTVEVALPDSFISAPLDPDSECLRYLGGDGTTLSIPGSRWNAENNNTFRCELRFTDSAWIAANPISFTVAATGLPANETYESQPVSWNYYPVNIARYPATHQAQITDSRGNLLCADTVPCGYFNADEVYILTYKFPAEWGAALPSGKNYTADVVWPADWAEAFRSSADMDLASAYGPVCSVDADGTTRFSLTETSEGRYSASCAFVPSGIAMPVQAPARIHLNDNTWQVNDLNVYMPTAILKQQAVLTPSLTLRMTDDSGEEEQIRGGAISTLYRTTGNYPNTADGFGKPALYTLRARIEGISSARSPQWGDEVRVSWPLLDALAQAGDLPSCLAPSGNGYTLGSLSRFDDGSWQAECSFRFPMSLPANTPAGTLSMELNSGVYSTTAQAYMYGDPFRQENITVNLTVPRNMLLNQPTEFSARLTDSSGGLSDYTRAVVNSGAVSLYGDWAYNYLTSCQGSYMLDSEGTASCSAFFQSTTDDVSNIHYELSTPGLENLFAVSYYPAQDFEIQPVRVPSASLSVKLLHMGTEMPLPASADDVFYVGDDYQLQFYLTPDETFRDVLNAVSVDSEGMVIDWYNPLLVTWGLLPGGSAGLNFYRDGDNFIARYDFNFDRGDLSLDGNLSWMSVQCQIPDWDIMIDESLYSVQMPSRIEKKPVSLSISDFNVDFSEGSVSDLFMNQTARFAVYFDGSLDHFDSTQMIVGYETDGYRYPIDCYPDYETGSLSCSFIAQCTNYTGGDYQSVCGSDNHIYAEYYGDAYNAAAAAEPKSFNIKRGEIRFYSETQGSLSRYDLMKLEGASEDLGYMEDVSVRVNGWGVDTFLPKEIRDQNGAEFKRYPVNFRYERSGSEAADETRMFLDVTFQYGPGEQPSSETISLKPQMVTDDTVMFVLDFGSYEMLDDGRVVRDVLADAVSITSLTVRYAGSELYGPASAAYEAEDLTFALKTVTVLDLETDMSVPGMLRFGGAASSEMMMQPFTVYCSQLMLPLRCSAELPLTEANEYGEPILSGEVSDGCWGKVTLNAGSYDLYVNQSFNPQCYLTGWDSESGILVAGKFNK